LGNVAKDCSALGVDPKTLVTLGVHLEAVESIKVADEAVVKDQAAIVEDLNRQLADLRKEVADLTEKLDAPTSRLLKNSVHTLKTATGLNPALIPCALRGPERAALPQKREQSEFFRNLLVCTKAISRHFGSDPPHISVPIETRDFGLWQSKRDELVGDDQRPETLNYIKNRITGLDAIPNEIMEAEASREAKVREIFREIKALVEAYRELYQPAQEFISNHPLAKDKFKLCFDARIICMGLDEQLLGRVNQGRKGTFCGVEEGKLMLKQLPLCKASLEQTTSLMALWPSLGTKAFLFCTCGQSRNPSAKLLRLLSGENPMP